MQFELITSPPKSNTNVADILYTEESEAVLNVW
jgi:hypothetical protein